MIRSARFSYERRLALASSKSPKTYFACVRGKPELRQEIESIIAVRLKQAQPAVLCEALRGNFSLTFRNDEGNDLPFYYQANIRKQHFIISAKIMHGQLTHLDRNKSEGADEIHQKFSSVLHNIIGNNSLANGRIPM